MAPTDDTETVATDAAAADVLAPPAEQAPPAPGSAPTEQPGPTDASVPAEGAATDEQAPPKRRRATKKAAPLEPDGAADSTATAEAPAKRTRSRKAVAAQPPADPSAEAETADGSAEPTAAGQPDASEAPAERPRKKAAKKAAKKSTRKPAQTAATATEQETEPEAADVAEDDQAAAGPSLSLVFQAPDLGQPQPRRRATRPASTPVVPAEEPPGVEAGTTELTEDEDEESLSPDAEHPDEPEAGDGPGRRSRRRRGGRGRRGRAREDEGDGDDAKPADDATPTSARADEARPEEDDDADDTAGSRRRRRRRRSGAPGEQEDPPGTVTRVRQPRARDEVTGVKGSTRLEAKKQRRREGREAGRRRTIITEAEFLARRESVDRVMLVRGREDRTQIAVLEDDVLVEHYVSRETTASMAGNIYLGRVQNVLPSMEAAFVDIGKGRNAVLYAGEVNWDAAGLEGNAPKRIENALRSGDTVLVQVTKDPIGHKGARLTSQISLPGRYLVYVPEGSMTGISRKLPDTERARLKAILKEVVPDTAGVIVRTAAEGASEEELRADVERLTATWDRIRDKAERTKARKAGSGGAPTLLHGEPDLTVRVIRDIFNEDFNRLVVAGDKAAQEVQGYIGDVAPDLAGRIETWTGERDLFAEHRVDEQIAKAMDRKVYLPSGGSLVIDRTEAMTVVDVNTGKFIGSGGNLEETVTKNNIEAAEEIVRQLRLRDIGGIIVIDFIDMVLESNRDLVVRRLLECLGRDRTKHQVAEVTSLGLVQMTRKRVGSGLIEVFGETCEHCGGRGIVIHTEPIERGPDANGGNGSGHPHGGNAAGGGRGSRRGGRGAGQQPTSGSEAAPADKPAPSGPTAAQIAAAAHAAALKAAGAHEHDADADHAPVTAPTAEPSDPSVTEAAEVAGDAGPDRSEAHEVQADVHDERSEPEERAEAEEGAEAEERAEAEEGGSEEPAPTADETVVPILLDEDFAADVRPTRAPAEDAQPVEEPAPIFEAPPETVVAPTRRRRGRVVAPAGPPGAGAVGGDPAGRLEGGAS